MIGHPNVLKNQGIGFESEATFILTCPAIVTNVLTDSIGHLEITGAE